MRISEGGRNGEASIGEAGIDRVLKRPLGRDDRQFIPYKSITLIEHDRKRVGRDVVVLRLSNASTLSWRIVGDADGFVDEVQRRIAAS